MLLSEDPQLTQAQRHKIDRILSSTPSGGDGLILDVTPPESYAPETACLSVLAHMSKRGELISPKACFIEPDGRHHWRN